MLVITIMGARAGTRKRDCAPAEGFGANVASTPQFNVIVGNRTNVWVAVARERPAYTITASGAALPRIMSLALSAIIMVEALRLAEIIRGMIEASITRRFCNPCTRS